MSLFSKIFFLAVLALTVVVVPVTYGSTIAENEYIFLMPVAFLFVSIVFLILFWRKSVSIFFHATYLVAMLRYVLYPALAEITGGYQGRSWVPPTIDSYHTAIFLMVYELLLVSLLLIYMEFRFIKKTKAVDVELILNGNSRLRESFVLLIFSLLLFFVSPDSLLAVTFVSPFDFIDEERIAPLSSFVAMLFITAKTIFFINFILYLSRKKWSKNLIFLLIFISSAINISIYFGTNRTAMLLNALVTMYLVYKVFGRKSINSIIFVGVVGFVLFSVLTEHRDYVKYSDDYLIQLSDSAQSYAGGVYNVAIGLEVPDYYPESSSFYVLMYDFIRPIVGLNLLVKDMDINYSNIYFNERMWTHVDRRSQIIPMLAQGNIFFGNAFSPILSILSVVFAYIFLNFAEKQKSIEMKFFGYLIVLRFAMFWGQNTMNLINYVSVSFLIPIAIIFVLNRFSKTQGISVRHPQGLVNESPVQHTQ